MTEITELQFKRIEKAAREQTCCTCQDIHGFLNGESFVIKAYTTKEECAVCGDDL